MTNKPKKKTREENWRDETNITCTMCKTKEAFEPRVVHVSGRQKKMFMCTSCAYCEPL